MKEEHAYVDKVITTAANAIPVAYNPEGWEKMRVLLEKNDFDAQETKRSSRKRFLFFVLGATFVLLGLENQQPSVGLKKGQFIQKDRTVVSPKPKLERNSYFFHVDEKDSVKQKPRIESGKKAQESKDGKLKKDSVEIEIKNDGKVLSDSLYLFW